MHEKTGFDDRFCGHVLVLKRSFTALEEKRGGRFRTPPPKRTLQKCLRFMQREDVTRSRLRSRPRTKPPCKVQEQPEWEISEPSQGAQCAQASREYRKPTSAPSSIPAFSTCSSTTPRRASTPIGLRNQLAGRAEHTGKLCILQPEHSETSPEIY